MTELKGANQIGRFRKGAERLISEISSYRGVSGIVLSGGLVRGFADRFSDLDIVVLLAKSDRRLKRKVRKMGLEEEKRSGIDVDLLIYSVGEFDEQEWDETTKWEYSRAEIAFDRKGETKRILASKFDVPQDFWRRKVAASAEYLGWYCCPSKESIGTIAEAWIERGNLVAAHYCLNYGVELLLEMMFALNREFLPAPKWRLFYSHRLRWVPKGYKNLIEEAIINKDFTISDFTRRLNAIQEIWRETVPKMEKETGRSLDQLHSYYVENVLHQCVR